MSTLSGLSLVNLVFTRAVPEERYRLIPVRQLQSAQVPGTLVEEERRWSCQFVTREDTDEH